ncbi:MAG: hypothetical protein OHK0052_21030 [Anaerolineales bacterium]
MLTRRALAYTLLSLAALLALAALIRRYQPADYTARWLLLALAAHSLTLVTLWRNLHRNHPPQTPTAVYPTLGIPNLVSLWRAVLIASAAGFLTLPQPGGALLWLPGVLYALGVLPDYIDGYLARITRRTTPLGETLDVSTDSLAVLSGTLLLVQYRQVGAWYLLVGFARYLYLAGLWLRQKRRQPIYPLPPNLSRRALAGAQMGLTLALLLPLFKPPATNLAALLFSLPFLYNFWRDWRFASGTAQPQPAAPAPRWLNRLALPAVRLYTAAFLIYIGIQTHFLADVLPPQALLFPQILLPLLLLLHLWVTFSLGLGFLARTASILALGLLGLHLRFGHPLTPGLIAALLCSLLTLFGGSGNFSLWHPEDELLQRRAGDSA